MKHSKHVGGESNWNESVTPSILSMTMLLLLFVVVVSAAEAATTLSQTASRLNYFYSIDHNVTVTILNDTNMPDVYINVSVPSGWSIKSSSANSVINGRLITWRFAALTGTGAEGIYYVVGSDGTVPELTKSTMAPSYNYTGQSAPIAGQNLTFVMIADTKVMDVIVELGRGRGNYPYSTRYGGTIYIPASTTTQLYFLNRLYNIAQFLANTTETAQSLSVYCEYPNYPTVTYHLVNNLVRDATAGKWKVNYSISEIEPSWWRMAYLGMEINGLGIGTNLSINCTDMAYSVSQGRVRVDNQTFTLSAATITPITVTAAASNVSIAQGQTENEITYNISNSGPYDIDAPQFEIQAPANSLFIGTRGELWGTATSKYVLTLPRLQSQQSFNTTLVTRFNVTGAQSIPFGAITSKFVPPWEATAYNPMELLQTATPSGSITVTSQTGAVITTVRGEIVAMREVVNDINTTASTIRIIVTHINSTVNSMNLTLNTVNTTLSQLNNTVRFTVIPLLNDIGANVTSVNMSIKDVKALVDCSNTTTTGVCGKLNNVTANLDDVNGTIVRINNTVTDIAGWQFNEQVRRFKNVDQNLSLARNQIDEVKSYLNCTTDSTGTVCNKLNNVTSIVDLINTTTQRAFVITQYVNTSRWGAYNAADLYNKIQDSISRTGNDTDRLLERVRNLKELTQEAVFLVTDSVGLQTDAKADLAKGDVSAAVSKLDKASSNLAEANTMVERYVSARYAGGANTEASGNFGIVRVLVTLLAGMALGVVSHRILIGRFRKEKTPHPPPERKKRE